MSAINHMGGWEAIGKLSCPSRFTKISPEVLYCFWLDGMKCEIVENLKVNNVVEHLEVREPTGCTLNAKNTKMAGCSIYCRISR